jgi:hypothetical protein
MNKRIKHVVMVTWLKCVRQERFTEFIRNVLENVHLEDGIRQGRMIRRRITGSKVVRMISRWKWFRIVSEECLY